MNFQSIRTLILVSLLFGQAIRAQTQLRASGSSALQQQGSQDKQPNGPSGNGEASSTEKVIPDPLLNLLVSKGLLTTEEARVIFSRDPASQRDLLATLLKDKGVISAADYDQLRVPAANTSNVAGSVTSPRAS